MRALAAIVLLAAAALPAAAQNDAASFPNRPIRIVVPFPAGGPTDINIRIIAQKMSENWGQGVVIENRPGANTASARRWSRSRRRTATRCSPPWTPLW
jgi:tripartite-type tricarboxylate transporter receptor subunit TctC